MNLVAFAYHVGFELVPPNMNPGQLYLHSDFMMPLRHQVRTALDRHASMAPNARSWLGVQRQATDGRVEEIQGGAVFVSPAHSSMGEVLACVESASRPWWVQCSQLPEERWHRGIVIGVLDMLLSWLVRLVPVLEERCPTLPSGPVALRIRFPDIETLSQRPAEMVQAPVPPPVALEDGGIVIDCVPRYLMSFLRPGNLGDRLMIASLMRGADSLCGRQTAPDAAMDEWLQTVLGSDSARFLKMTPSQTPEDVIYDIAALPKLRLLMPEDQAWSRLGLPRRAGCERKPGPVPRSQAPALINAAVDAAWERVKSRLVSLSRETVVERSLLNYVAARKEHRDWLRSMAARLAVYDNPLVMVAATEGVLCRDVAGLACRVIAEMAVCTSPYGSGSVCADTDIDSLVAEVSTILECANQSDALHYGVATRPPVILPNGSFGFDASVAQATGPLMTEHWRRTFREAAQDEEDGGDDAVEEGVPDPGFPRAFAAEFGLTPEQYQGFVQGLAFEAAELAAAHLRLRRSEVVHRLGDTGAVSPELAFESLALTPRARWDEKDPADATARDWYPWRYASAAP